MITREWSILETGEMRVLQDKSGISRNGYWRRKDFYGPRKTARNTRLACPNDGETNLRLFELGKTTQWLLKKDQKFEWTEAQQDAFDELKKRFTEEPVLMMPDHTKPFQIETDASKYATGAVLTQLDTNSDRLPVSFISKTFSPAEWNYEIYDQELLAIVRALEE